MLTAQLVFLIDARSCQQKHGGSLGWNHSLPSHYTFLFCFCSCFQGHPGKPGQIGPPGAKGEKVTRCLNAFGIISVFRLCVEKETPSCHIWFQNLVTRLCVCVCMCDCWCLLHSRVIQVKTIRPPDHQGPQVNQQVLLFFTLSVLNPKSSHSVYSKLLKYGIDPDNKSQSRLTPAFSVMCVLLCKYISRRPTLKFF